MSTRLIAAALFATASQLVQGAVVSGPGIGSLGPLTWEQLRFYGPSGGATLVYPDKQPKTIGSVLSGTDLCSDVDICGSTLRFETQLGGSVVASATTRAPGAMAVVRQDLYPSYGGLGVQGYAPATSTTAWQWSTKTRNQLPTNIGNTRFGKFVTTTTPARFYGADEINAGDTLTLTFTNKVELLGFHFFDAKHLTKGLTGGNFALSIDGGAASSHGFFSGFPFDAGTSLAGHSFTFSYATEQARSYYLGAVKFAQAVSPVPEPSSLALMFAGLAIVGAAGRRKLVAGSPAAAT